MKRGVTAAILLALLVQISLVSCQSVVVQSPVELEPEATPTAPPSSPDEPRRGGIVVISYGGGTPRHFNPAVASGTSTAIVGTQIFASPLRYDEHWNPQPYLAKSWDISRDGLLVTLHLVEGATFHDGHPITSEDVAFSVMTVKSYHPFKSMFAPVEEVGTPDPYTAVIRLSRPHPAILLAMSPALLPIIPKHIYGDGQDMKTHPANLAPVGSGPFRLVEYVPGESVVLERNDDYFISGRPYLDGLIIRLEPDPKAQVVDMQREEAHLLPLFVDLDALDRLGKCEHLVITSRGHEGVGAINWLAFNLLRPPLDDERVRQAIAYAVDPDFMVGYLHQGRSRRANSPISSDSPFYASDLPEYRVDLARANQLLNEAGHPTQPDGVRFSLTMDFIPVIPSQQRDVALYLERQLAKVGIKVNVRRSASFPEWAERVGNWDFDMTLDSVYNWGDPVIGVHRTYRCDNIRKGVAWSNTQNYCNPRVDELLTQAERTLDEVQRKALYKEFQQIVTEELPIMWLNLLPFHTVYHAGLGHPPLTIWGIHAPMDNIYWREPPDREYVPVPAFDSTTTRSRVQAVGMQAITLLQEVGLFEASKLCRDPEQDFLELEGTGLHLIGFTREGVIFMDNSGQMKPGIDISTILDLGGNDLLGLFLAAAEGAEGGHMHSEAVWPHPVTHRVTPMSAWCGRLTTQDMICALEWDAGDGP